MDYKVVTFLLLIGVFDVAVHGDHGKDPGHYRKKKIDEKCGTDQTCVAAAEKCLGDKDAKPPNDTMTDIEKLTAFNQCLESNGKGTDKINERDCSERRVGGATRARRSSGSFQRCKKEIFDFLRSLEESGDAASGEIRCCFFQAIGMDMLRTDNSINLEFFRQHLKDRISSQSVLDVYEEAFDTCVPKGDMCNVQGFRECVMDECISRMQTP